MQTRTIELVGRGLTLKIQTRLEIFLPNDERVSRDVESRDLPDDLPPETIYFFFHDVSTVDIPSAEFPNGVMQHSNAAILNSSDIFVPYGRRYEVDAEDNPPSIAVRIARDREEGRLDYTYVVEVFSQETHRSDGYMYAGGKRGDVIILQQAEDIPDTPGRSYVHGYAFVIPLSGSRAGDADPLGDTECEDCPFCNDPDSDDFAMTKEERGTESDS